MTTFTNYWGKFNMHKLTLLVPIILAVALLSGCGYKGPLYLPDEPDSSLTSPPAVSENQSLNQNTQ